VLRDLCITYAPENPEYRIAVVGDSHAGVLVPAFEAISRSSNMTVVRGSHAGCPPLIGVWLMRGGDVTEKCRKAVDHFAAQVVASDTDAVVLAGRWSMYATGAQGDLDWRTAVTTDSRRNFITQAERLEELEKGFRRTISFYREHGIKVIMVAQVPEQRQIPSILVQSAMLMGLDDAAARQMFERSFLPRADHDRLQAGARTVMRRVARDMNVVLVEPDQVFAEGDQYVWLRGDDSLYRDDDHLSEMGARQLGPLMQQALQELHS